MQCPRCGYEVAEVHASCPQCGLPLAHVAQQPAADAGSAEQVPPAGLPRTQQPAPYGPYAQPGAPSMPLSQGYAPYLVPPASDVPASYGQSMSPDPATIYPYGVPAAPSMPLGAPPAAPYGMPAGPSVPYGFTAPYPGWGMPPIPPAPPQRTNHLLIAALIIVLVVVVGGSAAAILALAHQQPAASATHPGGMGASTATVSPADTVIYQNSLQGGAAGWSHSSNHCTSSADGYHVNNAACFAPIGSQQDVDVSVQMQQVSGAPVYLYGISLRHAAKDKRYDVGIDSDGEWAAYRCDGVASDGSLDCHHVVAWTANKAIHGGLNTTNTLEVRAKGTHFEVYVNGVDVGGFDDATYGSGQVGLEAASTIGSVFTNIVIKRLNS